MDKIGFDNIQDAVEYYWEPSRNPYGSYEIDYELMEGEREFCETEGFVWEDWNNVKHDNFLRDGE